MNTLLKYAKTIKFWLKDYDKTSKKYKDYKNEKIKEYLEHTKRFESWYDWTTDDSHSSIGWYYYDLRNNLTSKSKIREMKTWINSIVRNNIKREIEQYFDDELNTNEKRIFTIKTYLAFYNEINEWMSEFLIDMVENQ